MIAPRFSGFQSPGFQASQIPGFLASNGLLAYQKYRRLFMDIDFFFLPGCNILRTDGFFRARNINRNTYPRIGIKHPDHRLDQRIIPIRRFNEDLRGS